MAIPPFSTSEEKGAARPGHTYIKDLRHHPRGRRYRDNFARSCLSNVPSVSQCAGATIYVCTGSVLCRPRRERLAYFQRGTCLRFGAKHPG